MFQKNHGTKKCHKAQQLSWLHIYKLNMWTGQSKSHKTCWLAIEIIYGDALLKRIRNQKLTANTCTRDSVRVSKYYGTQW